MNEIFIVLIRAHTGLGSIAGFTHEYRDYYAYGKHSDVKVKVFRLCPDDTHMQELRSFLTQCETDRAEIFNLYAMMTMPLLHGLPIYKAHNCMSFTAKIAALSGCVKVDKSVERCSIPELDALLSPYLYFEGMLPRQSSAGYKQYMRRFEPAKFLTDMLRLNGQLISRMVWKRNTKRSDNW